MPKTNKLKFFLPALILFSFLIRLSKINNLPLFADEIDVGNQAYSLLKTARDYKGNFLPTYLESFNEWRAPLLIYATVPGLAIFGHSALAVRLPSVIFGLLSIFFFYKLIFYLSKKQSLAALCSLLLSLNPWHFHYSRAAFEVTLLLALLLSAAYFFYHRRHLLSLILFALTFYTYNTANIFTPLIIFYLFIHTKTKLRPRLLLPLILFIPLALNVLSGSAVDRFSQISIFTDQKSISQIIFKRTGFSSSPTAPERLFHNKANSWLRQFTANYLTGLSLDFLFINGDPNPRHTPPGFGLLPYTLFLPLILGLIKAGYKQPTTKLMAFWLLTAPIAASLTQNGGQHATRLFLLLPPICFFAASGIIHLKKHSRPLLLIFLVLSFHYLINFSHEYFIHYPAESFENWQYGYQQLFSSIPTPTKRLFVSNSQYSSLKPYIFFQKTDPRLTQSTTFIDQPQKLTDNLLGFQLDPNTFFINNWQSNDVIDKVRTISQTGDVFVLFQLSEIPGDWDFSQDPLPDFTTIKTVYNPNQTIFGQIIQKQ